MWSLTTNAQYVGLLVSLDKEEVATADDSQLEVKRKVFAYISDLPLMVLEIGSMHIPPEGRKLTRSSGASPLEYATSEDAKDSNQISIAYSKPNLNPSPPRKKKNNKKSPIGGFLAVRGARSITFRLSLVSVSVR